RISCRRSIAAAGDSHPHAISILCAGAHTCGGSSRHRSPMRVSAQRAMLAIHRLQSMNIVLTGALVGTGLACSLVALEYVLLRRSSSERARKTRRREAFD